ncbi:hypothetical protein FDP41_010826 [Naegleria fowleri]|uniref:Uncharacterized protein n=1 Tax=Naegleria fowleri TaxID=5763 RepID=A0A6A5C045_NAEFO|nr:uncharacterized protein FDP41_010826 [Naegleria fowleri]KAF0982847.1 hypothetical protein FDP41_010826 [Naegleria fowleri]CAG4717799.1 unnamed protein product [Naegleria fowleri]
MIIVRLHQESVFTLITRCVLSNLRANHVRFFILSVTITNLSEYDRSTVNFHFNNTLLTRLKKLATSSSSQPTTSNKNFKWLSQQYKLKDTKYETLSTSIISILGTSNYLNYNEKHHEYALCEWMSKLFHDALKYHRLDISKLTLANFEKIFQKFDESKNSYFSNECKEIVMKLLNVVMPIFIEKNKIVLKELTFFNMNLSGTFPGENLQIFHALDRFNLLDQIEELDFSANHFGKVDESWLMKLSRNGTSKLKRFTLSGNSL